MVEWEATVLRVIDDRTVLIHTYNVPAFSVPPYPGFRAVEEWLVEHFPDSTIEVMYMEGMPEGGPMLKVAFQDSKDLMQFILAKT